MSQSTESGNTQRPWITTVAHFAPEFARASETFCSDGREPVVVIDTTNVSVPVIPELCVEAPYGCVVQLHLEALPEATLVTISRYILCDVLRCTVTINGRVMNRRVAELISSKYRDARFGRIWRNAVFWGQPDRISQDVTMEERQETKPPVEDTICVRCGKPGWHAKHFERGLDTGLPGTQWLCMPGADGWWNDPTKREIREFENAEKRRERMKNATKGTTGYVNIGERGKAIMKRLDAQSKRRKLKMRSKEEKERDKIIAAEKREWLKQSRLEARKRALVDAGAPVLLFTCRDLPLEVAIAPKKAEEEKILGKRKFNAGQNTTAAPPSRCTTARSHSKENRKRSRCGGASRDIHNTGNSALGTGNRATNGLPAHEIENC